MTDRWVHIYVPGIRTKPGASRNWVGRAVTWTHLEIYQPAEKVEYYTLAITRPFGQPMRSRKLEKVLRFYQAKQFHINLACHSNGQDVVMDTLLHMRGHGLAFIDRLSIISGAAQADARYSGLNSLEPYIGQLTVYTAGKDAAMKAADTKFGRLLGYGTTGRDGITHASEALLKKMTRIHRENYRHGTWFEPTHFDETMRKLTATP